MTQRLMPDPIPAHFGILTRTELAACVRVLEALRTPIEALAVTSWGADEQRAYASLVHARYVRTCERASSRRGWAWDRIVATEAGLRWLAQVTKNGTGGAGS